MVEPCLLNSPEVRLGVHVCQENVLSPRALVENLFGCLFTRRDVRAAGQPPMETKISGASSSDNSYLKNSRSIATHKLLGRLRDRVSPAIPAPLVLRVLARPATSPSSVLPGSMPMTRVRPIPAGFFRLPSIDLWGIPSRNRLDQSCPDLNQWVCDYRLVVPIKALVELGDEGPVAARRWARCWSKSYISHPVGLSHGKDRDEFSSWMTAVHLAAAWMWCLDLGCDKTAKALCSSVHPDLLGLAAAYLIFVINRSSTRVHPELSYLIPEAMTSGLQKNPNLVQSVLMREASDALALWFVVHVSRMRTWDLGRRSASSFLNFESAVGKNILARHPREDFLRVTLLARARDRSVADWVTVCGGQNIWNAPLESSTGYVGYKVNNGRLNFLSNSGRTPTTKDWIRLQVRCLAHPVLCRDWKTWSAVLRGEEPPTALTNTIWGIHAAMRHGATAATSSTFPGVFWSVPSYAYSSYEMPAEYIDVPSTCLIDALVAGARMGWDTDLCLWDTAARPRIRKALSHTAVSGVCIASNFWWWASDHRRIFSDFLKKTKAVVDWDTKLWLLPSATSDTLMDMGSVGHLALGSWTLSRSDLWVLRRWWSIPNQAGTTMIQKLKADQRAWVEQLLLRASSDCLSKQSGAHVVTSAVLRAPNTPRTHRKM